MNPIYSKNEFKDNMLQTKQPWSSLGHHDKMAQRTNDATRNAQKKRPYFLCFFKSKSYCITMSSYKVRWVTFILSVDEFNKSAGLFMRLKVQGYSCATVLSPVYRSKGSFKMLFMFYICRVQ